MTNAVRMRPVPAAGRSSVTLALLAALACLLGAPAATAHGPPAAREVDTRVLTDDDGLLAYGGCVEGQCPPGAGEGLDVLALDVREAWIGREPALVFRMLYQTSVPQHDGRALVLELTVGGQVHTFRATSEDGAIYLPEGFDRLDGPFDVGDGHPKALDGWVRAVTLGAANGTALEGISLASTHHEEPDDVMPGTWYANGAEVPHLPHDPADPGEAVAPHPAGTYTLKGPAPLVTIAASAPVLDGAQATPITLTLTNALATLPQFTRLAVEGPAGSAARLDPGPGNTTGVALDPGASREVTLAMPASGWSSGILTVVATTDLGARAELAIQAVARPAANATGTATASTAPHDHPDEAGTPAPGAALLAASLAIAVLARRR